MTTVKNNATFLLTPPQREAVEELARAYYQYMDSMANYRKFLPEASVRLMAAQDALGMQLIPNSMLQRTIAEAA